MREFRTNYAVPIILIIGIGIIAGYLVITAPGPAKNPEVLLDSLPEQVDSDSVKYALAILKISKDLRSSTGKFRTLNDDIQDRYKEEIK